jgi:hypothetical protein
MTNILLLVCIALLAVIVSRDLRARLRERRTPPPDTSTLPIQTGQAELDTAMSALLTKWTEALDGAIDEVYATLTHAYPGLYANPDQDTDTTVEFRTREPGTGRWVDLSPAAALYAHRKGFEVERRQSTVTEWEVEPNPNKMVARRVPVMPPPAMAMPTEHPDHPTGYDAEAAKVLVGAGAGHATIAFGGDTGKSEGPHLHFSGAHAAQADAL